VLPEAAAAAAAIEHGATYPMLAAAAAMARQTAWKRYRPRPDWQKRRARCHRNPRVT
jgi:hypothetical protein